MRALASIAVPAVLFVSLWHFVPDLIVDSNTSDRCGVFSGDCLDVAVEKAVIKALDLSSGNVERYDDHDYGFSMAVPTGWSKIVYDEFAEYEHPDADVPLWSEPGYAVGFESPQSNEHDRFADYILIEVLPGEETGLFETTQENERLIQLETESVYYDRLFIDSEQDAAIEVDLVIFQRGVQALGYTVSFYAIGEPANEQVLFKAFKNMLSTFSQFNEPFVII